LFENIRRELQGIKDEAVKSRALETLKEMEAAKNKPSFSGLFTKLMGITADCITIAPPLITALTQFFPK
jgi:hypothetical protein